MLILKSSKGTRVYIEPDIPEVAKLKKSLQEAPTRKRTVMPAVEPKTILYIKQLMRQELKGSDICHAEVIKVYQTGNWSYPSCRTCHRKPGLRDKRPYCKDCKTYVTDPVFRYIIQIRIKDATGEIDGTAFEEAGTELVGFSLDDMSAMREDVALGNDDVCDKLEEMVGKQFYFNLKVTDYNSKPVTISMAWPDECNCSKHARITLLSEASN